MNEQLVSLIGEAVLSNWLPLISLLFSFCAGLVALTWFVSNLIHKKEIRLLETQLAHQKEQFSQFETIVNQRVEALKEQAGLSKNTAKDKSLGLPITHHEQAMYSLKQNEHQASESSMSKFLKNMELLSGLVS